jgi:hypothetical protein
VEGSGTGISMTPERPDAACGGSADGSCVGIERPVRVRNMDAIPIPTPIVTPGWGLIHAHAGPLKLCSPFGDGGRCDCAVRCEGHTVQSLYCRKCCGLRESGSGHR